MGCETKLLLNFAKKNDMHIPAELMDLCSELNFNPVAATPITGSGSDRKYWRLTDDADRSYIGCYGPDATENECFVNLSAVLANTGVNVPRIAGFSNDKLWYIQEDLGDNVLLQLLSGSCRMELAGKAMVSLAHFQTVEENIWKGNVTFKPFGKRLAMWDLNYFKYEFLKPLGIIFNEENLEDDFGKFASELTLTPRTLWGLMHRDAQSRNVMVCDDKLFWIDYQGARLGPCVYDAVSFLWQSKAAFTPEERATLLNEYAGSFAAIRGIDKDDILDVVDKFALLRTLQVLGAYGFRGIVEKKSHFIESIPGALSNLSELLERGVLEPYPELGLVCRKCIDRRHAFKQDTKTLTVYVFSFSYKKGYPEDFSGNGGGFMFDCRGMHNPGRYDEYKSLTGLDAPVRDFLENKGEVGQFVEDAINITLPTVSRYKQRGFTSLQVGFGCTGGQHRSVYCAQDYAEKLSSLMPDVDIIVTHREQNTVYEFKH